MAINISLPENIYTIDGLRLGVAYAGIRKQEKPDLVLIELPENSITSAVFTKNVFCAAPVIIAKQHILHQPMRYLLINAGNANAGTGEQGLATAQQSCEYLAEKSGIATHQVLPFSTGVIGEYLALEKVKQGIDKAFENLQSNNWLAATYAIMTTDTIPKIVSKQIILDNKTITITGMVKGAGMIHPNMATLLAFIATDLAIEAELFKQTWQDIVERSFNCISVDGDTSTNDAAVLFSTQAIQIDLKEENYKLWWQALLEVAQSLAQAVIRDGEGASKFVTIAIKNGRDRAECKQLASVIATSPLIKTALFASDPNWGRILAAIGRANLIDLDIHQVDIYLNDVMIVRQGERDALYTEEQGIKAMQPAEIILTIDLHRGYEHLKFWTCDFSYDYVRINAEYRT